MSGCYCNGCRLTVRSLADTRTLDATLRAALRTMISTRVLTADKARADRAAADLAALDFSLDGMRADAPAVNANVILVERDAARESRRRNPRGYRQAERAMRGAR